MWRCDSCNRHVLAVSPICPFCAQASAMAVGLAAVTPILLSACYGMPPCDDTGGTLIDNDGDGYYQSNGGCYGSYNDDCNDEDPTINPGAVDVCGDDIDQNCDGIVASADEDEVCNNGQDDDCDGEIDEVDCVEQTFGTTPSTGDTGGLTDPPTTPPTGAGAIAIAYTWSAGVPIANCAEAGVVFLEGSVDRAGPDAPSPVGAVCDDQALVVGNLVPGAYAVVISATSDDGVRTWDSGPIAIEVLADQTIAVDATLTCSPSEACN